MRYSSKKVIVDLVYGTTITAGCEASCVYSYLWVRVKDEW